jgi:hypothetical protein
VRRATTVGLVLVAVAAALAGVTWLGASWAGADGEQVPAAARTAPAPSTVSTAPARSGVSTAPARSGVSTVPTRSGVSTVPAPASPDEPAVGDQPSPADRSAEPADDTDWAAVLTELYVRRSAAFTDADPAVLAEVHVTGSALLAHDTDQVQQLVTAGQRLDGFAPRLVRVVEVTAQGPTRYDVRLVDALPAYRVVRSSAPDAPVVTEVGARGEAAVQMVLERTAAGWRIADARLSG